MPRSIEFALGLLEHAAPAFASFDDLSGEHGDTLRLFQRNGFLFRDAEPNPVPSCPRCAIGTLLPSGDRLICTACLSVVPTGHLSRWRFDTGAFLSWLTRELRLDGDARPVDAGLWQLGGVTLRGVAAECFALRGDVSAEGRARLLAYRNAVLLRFLPASGAVAGFGGTTVPLTDLVGSDGETLAVTQLADAVACRGAVRFDDHSGAVWAGDAWLGETPYGSKEYHFLACLHDYLDRFVAYADLKQEVLRRSGSSDATEEATFCQKLKSRAKRWVPEIDKLIATTNKGDGYRLRGRVDLS